MINKYKAQPWVRFSTNSCYKNLVYSKCVSWYFIESSIRWARTVY